MSEIEMDDDGAQNVELEEMLDTLKQQHGNEIIKNEDDQKKEIMNLLHDFNKIKDATQVVLGALANIDGVTIKDMHLKYNLPID
ncbi:DNA repair protein SWI5 homolog [Episyrphus balteatus]|uniref:DNA repair protein SWI5 homolog n=1 Tax=Episyrphus balteatus TaxID=286459 RepID=UPI00248648C8|nr:DNA repair protein SWI5 homolog [Episyrphus balteatus]